MQAPANTTPLHTAIYRNTLQLTTTRCNTLQHTATHYNTLQRTVTHCNTLQHTATHCDILQHTATHYTTPDRQNAEHQPTRHHPPLPLPSWSQIELNSVLQCVAVCCSVSQCVAVCCSVLQCVAVCRNVLQYVMLAHALHSVRQVCIFIAAT